MNILDDLLSKGFLISCDHLGVSRQSGEFCVTHTENECSTVRGHNKGAAQKEGPVYISSISPMPDKPATPGREKGVYTYTTEALRPVSAEK